MHPVIVCDDHVAIRHGVKAILEEAKVNVVGECGSIEELKEIVEQFPTSIIVTDLGISGLAFPDMLKQIRGVSTDVRVIVYSGRDTPVSIQLCYKAGALAFVPKTDEQDQIVNAINRAEKGLQYFSPDIASTVITLQMDRQNLEARLSDRELELFKKYSAGLDLDQIAKECKMEKKSVSNAITMIGNKLDRPRSTFGELARTLGYIE